MRVSQLKTNCTLACGEDAASEKSKNEHTRQIVEHVTMGWRDEKYFDVESKNICGWQITLFQQFAAGNALGVYVSTGKGVCESSGVPVKLFSLSSFCVQTVVIPSKASRAKINSRSFAASRGPDPAIAGPEQTQLLRVTSLPSAGSGQAG